MKDEIKTILKNMPSVMNELDVISNEDLEQICSAAANSRSVSFETPVGSHPLDTSTTLQILGLVAQYIAIGISTWQVMVSKAAIQGAAKALDEKVLSQAPPLSSVGEQTRLEATSAIVGAAGK